MRTNKLPSTRNIIKRICAHAASYSQDDLDSLKLFIRYFYAYTSLEDLGNRSIEDLYAIALSHWKLMQSAGSNETKLAVFNPSLEKDGWESRHTVIQISLPDSPFLIDSIRMEINRLGFKANIMIYMGGMLVTRDEFNRVVSVARYKGQEKYKGHLESPIYIEVDQQAHAKGLADIKENIRRVIHDVQISVRDWQPMRNSMTEVIQEIKDNPSSNTEEDEESAAFLEWLLEDDFTFLGVRDYTVVGSGEELALSLLPGSGLGVLTDETNSKKHRLMADLPEQARSLILSSEHRLIISKTNTKSTVHRSAYTDYVGFKRFDAEGRLIGERRFIGLYTSTAYSSDPLAIPFLRHKVAYVLKKSQLPLRSHSGKDLKHILANMPRDDLFQATTDELYHLSMGILHLQERRCVRLFVREDAYGRYISSMVYVPRDIFNTKLLRSMQAIIKKEFNALEMSFNTEFSTSVLARIHFIVRVDSKQPLKYNLQSIEQQLIDAAKSWEDELYEQVYKYFSYDESKNIYLKYKSAFPIGYREEFKPHQAIYDIQRIEKIKSHNQIEMTVYRSIHMDLSMIRFKLFRMQETMPLSDVLPILENLGFRVVGEVPYEVSLESGTSVWINDFDMEYVHGNLPDLSEITNLLEEAFSAIWHNKAENDELNHLVIQGYFSWREISIFRGYAKYLQQVSFPFSLQYIAETFINNVSVASVLLNLFHGYFNPKLAQDDKSKLEVMEKNFFELLDSVTSLDHDRIFRHFLDIIKATLRTNFYQAAKDSISFKFSPKDIPGIELPLPAYEVFVYSPRFEGVHLRMAKVARGGIRWSDRREDFRTEVLGLMKAQEVKNSVIVPSGAKGGFVVKRPMLKATRDEIFEEAKACYQGFICGLLDITDNWVGDEVIHPDDLVMRDDADPYLVVAADKGTATFSDIANKISIERDFWLGDAFASGGSTGYDHKKMGITARGAWVSAERQFQELDIQIDQAPVKVVGIGDMSGDVFGNGVLLSNNMKLVAAFNHLHIFIDPNPDPKQSFKERKRLFDLKRSTWADYDESLISNGGGVFSRSCKSIQMTAEMKSLLDIDVNALVPNDLIRAILKAPVDLIWNGGIGTYVKSSAESNDDASDRTNNNTRVNGCELRSRVVCEAGNLGLTQLARIEYELSGGKVNTDFIDNSAGVDCSDHEVNIKVLLDDVVAQGKLSLDERNKLLSKMTTEVSDLVLQNNYHQNRILSYAVSTSGKHMDVYRRYMDKLEKDGRLNRELQYLPTDKIMVDRKNAGLGLTKPELSVLLAYTKIMIEHDIVNANFLNDPYIQQYVKNAFPTLLRQRYAKEMLDHRLYKEIVATQLSNHMVSDMGIAFVYTMFDETGATLESIIKAYVISQNVFRMQSVFADIESIDYKVSAQVQYQMMSDIIRLVRRSTRWFLRNSSSTSDINETVTLFSNRIAELYDQMPDLMAGMDGQRFSERRDEYIKLGVPAAIATTLSTTDIIFHALNIIEMAEQHSVPIYDIAKTYFSVIDRLHMLWFRDLIDTYPTDNHWMVLAKAAYKGDLDWIQRQLTFSVWSVGNAEDSLDDKLEAWFKRNQSTVNRWECIVSELQSIEHRDFAMLSVAIRELADITKAV